MYGDTFQLLASKTNQPSLQNTHRAHHEANTSLTSARLSPVQMNGVHAVNKFKLHPSPNKM